MNEYRHEDYDLWIAPLLEVQDRKEKFVTVEEAREVFGFRSRSGAEKRLKFLVRMRLAKKVKGNHYHIKVKK